MEEGAVAGDRVVPAPLGGADIHERGFHLLLGGAQLPGLGCLEVSLGDHRGGLAGQLILACQFHLDRLAELLLRALVAVQTGIADVVQRAADLVARVLDAALTHVGHVAVGAGQAVAGMYAGLVGLVVRVLGLEHGRLAQLVGEVGEAVVVVVLLHLLRGEPFLPGQGDHCGHLLLTLVVPLGLLEVVLDVALGADQGAHVLVGDVRDLEAALGVQGALEVVAAQGQLHGLVVVAVAAADGVDDLVTVLGPLAGEILHLAIALDHPRHVRRLAGPAGGGLGPGDRVHRRAGAQGVDVVFQGVVVTARLVVVLGEGVAGPEDDDVRVVLEHVADLVALPGLHEGVVLPRVMLAPLRGAGLAIGDGRHRVDGLLFSLVLPDGHGQEEHRHHDEHAEDNDDR